MCSGWKVWDATIKEYRIDDQPPINNTKLCQYGGNSKSLNAIVSGLTKFVFRKVMRCKTAKEAWDKLKIIYEGAYKVKESAKIQKYKEKF